MRLFRLLTVVLVLAVSAGCTGDDDEPVSEPVSLASLCDGFQQDLAGLSGTLVDMSPVVVERIAEFEADLEDIEDRQAADALAAVLADARAGIDGVSSEEEAATASLDFAMALQDVAVELGVEECETGIETGLIPPDEAQPDGDVEAPIEDPERFVPVAASTCQETVQAVRDAVASGDPVAVETAATAVLNGFYTAPSPPGEEGWALISAFEQLSLVTVDETASIAERVTAVNEAAVAFPDCTI